MGKVSELGIDGINKINGKSYRNRYQQDQLGQREKLAKKCTNGIKGINGKSYQNRYQWDQRDQRKN